MELYELNLDEYLKHLEILVNTDSGSKDPEGIKKVAVYLGDLYIQMGWSVKVHQFDDEAGPCLEIRNTNEENIDLLLIGHMDTVFPKGTAKERPFDIKGDKVYGPGVVDMKSGLLSMYYVLKSLKLNQLERVPSICIALNSDEEISSMFSYKWIEGLARKSKASIVLEPARKNGALVKERKGVLKYSIDFTGVAAHAGVEPEKGVSAITELGYWILELNKLNDYDAGTTVNVGVVSGGSAPNVVAEKANAVVDIRFKFEEELQKVERLLKVLSENPKLKGMKVSVTKLGFRPPLNPSEESKKLYKLVEEVGKELEINIKWVSTGGGSDANFTSFVGVPTVDTLGPIGAGAHGIDEYLEISSIEPRLNLLRGVIIKILNIKDS
ncbi:M20 family metallopeptidase [Crassaminicella thermophila]|uniref:M20 family metallopeptidase n=1 Tax=Crassaminicella thermophila TaxID=2599308 RepID=A0A5C0SEH9_CRATE|nr:M20 family metallopeptidase [Crassaminicella thermophila]QEK13035.1 M20 family metallopeptidase [Crassaminicella thermophila]